MQMNGFPVCPCLLWYAVAAYCCKAYNKTTVKQNHTMNKIDNRSFCMYIFEQEPMNISTELIFIFLGNNRKKKKEK